MRSEHYFDYNIPAFCFLERARTLIKRFDDGEVECLFYAALELRMGIEARLFTYIESALELAKRPPEQIKEYQATKLLKKLANINPEALDPVTVGIGIGNGPIMPIMRFTPITQELAANHGKLGEMLHFKFFRNNPHWYYKFKTTEPNRDPEYKTLFTYRDFVEEVLTELEKATSGDLLNPPPSFLSQLDALNTDKDEASEG